MKKNVKKLLAGALAMLMLFAMVACSAEETVAEDPVVSQAEAAVAEYVENAKAEVEAESDENATLALEARGTNVVFKFTYNTLGNLSDDDFNALKSALDAELENQRSTMLETLSEMQTEEESITAIVFEYYDNTGKLISSAEFK